MEKLLKKDTKFEWNKDCQGSLDKLKHKMATAPILIFPYWKKEFHVHVDASSIVLGIVLTQLERAQLTTQLKPYRDDYGMV